MRKYKVITQKDRQLIATLYDAGTPLPTIAAAVDVSLATLYRELARGYTGAFNPKGCRAYSAAKAVLFSRSAALYCISGNSSA